MSLSKRRRRKTVHFGDNFLLQVCANTNFYMPPYEQMETNVQKFFNFIETVLSTWVTEEAPPSQGDTSEMDERAIEKRRRKKKIRKQIIYRLAKEVTKLNKSTVMGNLRYRHIHWNEKQDAERCNALFLLKISDDDRMSLTTAVSDEDEGESVMNSPYKAKQTGTAAASFNCTGAVRKAG
ncbi:hypothetical protein HUJ05_005723 [Dendroctonus ponderosae]|nr:hypothetical protein HUJ05_005723 [Dendroctonus ponderosae]